MLKNSCSAFVGGPSLCRNGFTQNAACSGIGCPTCGRVADTPACLRDDFRDSYFKGFFDDAGKPRFAIIADQAGKLDGGAA
jgi:hypothetical protein